MNYNNITPTHVTHSWSLRAGKRVLAGYQKAAGLDRLRGRGARCLQMATQACIAPPPSLGGAPWVLEAGTDPGAGGEMADVGRALCLKHGPTPL